MQFQHAILFLLAAGAMARANPVPLRQDDANDDVVAEAFRICDLDGNGWISLAEAETTLGMNRSEFRKFDANNDGRVLLPEFQTQGAAVVERLGFAPSAELRDVDPNADMLVATTDATLAGLLSLFDLDRSGGLSAAELDGLLRQYDTDVSAAQLLGQADRNDSGQLELEELGPLIGIADDLSTLTGRSGTTAPLRRPPPTVSFLGSTLMPAPREVGHFRRLDADGSGGISMADLGKLGQGARIPVRPGAVISALDRDGDGTISESEFWTSMRRP